MQQEREAFLIPIHSHPLALPAKLALGAGTDRSGTRAAVAGCTALLERKQLFGAEALVSFVFDVDGAPAVLACADGLAVEGEAVFAADYCKGDD